MTDPSFGQAWRACARFSLFLAALCGCGSGREPAEVDSASGESNRDVRQLAEFEWWIARTRLDAALAQHARDHRCYFVPFERGNVVVGVKLYGVKSQSLPDQLGIRNGDMIAEVNGISTNAADGYLRIRDELQRANRIVVTLERGGRQLTLTYRLSEPGT
jgi:type II secretory pathway component PulC